MLQINTAIEKSYDDKVFFYAKRIDFDHTKGWTINVQPDACMVCMRPMGLPFDTVSDLRSRPMEVSSELDGDVFKGEILFSAGVLLFLGNDLLMFNRDDTAPTDPRKWTSPAGRSDREPLLTALKEFHEEVIVLDSLSGKPVYVDIENNPYAQEIEEVYQDSLKRKGHDATASNWIRLVAKQATHKINNVYPVKVQFGKELVDSSLKGSKEFFSFMDKPNSTLELLLPLVLDYEQLSDLQLVFYDGEYDRKVKLFSTTEFLAMPPKSLVNTMRNVQELIEISSR